MVTADATETSEERGVRILSFCTADQIRRFELDGQFGDYARYRSLYTRRESLEEIAREPGANITLAIAGGETIVGFGILLAPRPDERWALLPGGKILEVKAIEVCRRWRGKRVARGILESLLDFERLEEHIVYMVGYAWTWDLDGSGISAQAYRTRLIDLFAPFGFQEYPTNEPNICLKPENLFMGRIGSRVPENVCKDFKWLRFGITSP